MMLKQLKIISLVVSTLIFSQITLADKLALHPGMTGVPDMGLVPCETLSRMHVISPRGTRRASLYWAGGYIYGKTGKLLDDIIADSSNPDQWNWDNVTDVMINFCGDNDEGTMIEAADSLLKALTK